MSPDDSKLVRWVIYAAIGLVTGAILPLLAWLGKRQVTAWERKIRNLEDEIEDLEGRLRGQHDDVADQITQLADEVRDLRSDLQ